MDTSAENTPPPDRSQAKTEQLQTFQGRVPEMQGQYLAVTVLYVPCSLLRTPLFWEGGGRPAEPLRVARIDSYIYIYVYR